jgi:hypothetical protein
MRLCSWMMWLVASRIWLFIPSVVVAVDGELRSVSWRSWDVAPVDG